MIKNILISASAVLFLSGCLSVTKELPSYNTYKLSIENKPLKNKNINKTIKIFEPIALSSINDTAVGYFLNDNQFESYALSKFSDTPSKMLQYLMVEYLNSTGNYKFVTASKLNLDTEYKLFTQVEAFHQIITKEGSVVKLEVSVFLKNKSSNVYFKRFAYRLPTQTVDAKGAVEALNKVSNSFLVDLDLWITDNLQ